MNKLINKILKLINVSLILIFIFQSLIFPVINAQAQSIQYSENLEIKTSQLANLENYQNYSTIKTNTELIFNIPTNVQAVKYNIYNTETGEQLYAGTDTNYNHLPIELLNLNLPNQITVEVQSKLSSTEWQSTSTILNVHHEDTSALDSFLQKVQNLINLSIIDDVDLSYWKDKFTNGIEKFQSLITEIFDLGKTGLDWLFFKRLAILVSDGRANETNLEIIKNTLQAGDTDLAKEQLYNVEILNPIEDVYNHPEIRSKYQPLIDKGTLPSHYLDWIIELKEQGRITDKIIDQIALQLQENKITPFMVYSMLSTLRDRADINIVQRVLEYLEVFNYTPEEKLSLAIGLLDNDLYIDETYSLAGIPLYDPQICTYVEELIQIPRTVTELKYKLVTQDVKKDKTLLSTPEYDYYQNQARIAAQNKYREAKGYSTSTDVKTSFIVYNASTQPYPTWALQVWKDGNLPWYAIVEQRPQGPYVTNLYKSDEQALWEPAIEDLKRLEVVEQYIEESTIYDNVIASHYEPQDCNTWDNVQIIPTAIILPEYVEALNNTIAQTNKFIVTDTSTMSHEDSVIYRNIYRDPVKEQYIKDKGKIGTWTISQIEAELQAYTSEFYIIKVNLENNLESKLYLIDKETKAITQLTAEEANRIIDEYDPNNHLEIAEPGVVTSLDDLPENDRNRYENVANQLKDIFGHGDDVTIRLQWYKDVDRMQLRIRDNKSNEWHVYDYNSGSLDFVKTYIDKDVNLEKNGIDDLTQSELERVNNISQKIKEAFSKETGISTSNLNTRLSYYYDNDRFNICLTINGRSGEYCYKYDGGSYSMEWATDSIPNQTTQTYIDNSSASSVSSYILNENNTSSTSTSGGLSYTQIMQIGNILSSQLQMVLGESTTAIWGEAFNSKDNPDEFIAEQEQKDGYFQNIIDWFTPGENHWQGTKDTWSDFFNKIFFMPIEDNYLDFIIPSWNDIETSFSAVLDLPQLVGNVIDDTQEIITHIDGSEYIEAHPWLAKTLDIATDILLMVYAMPVGAAKLFSEALAGESLYGEKLTPLERSLKIIEIFLNTGVSKLLTETQAYKTALSMFNNSAFQYGFHLFDEFLKTKLFKTGSSTYRKAFISALEKVGKVLPEGFDVDHRIPEFFAKQFPEVTMEFLEKYGYDSINDVRLLQGVTATTNRGFLVTEFKKFISQGNISLESLELFLEILDEKLIANSREFIRITSSY